MKPLLEKIDAAEQQPSTSLPEATSEKIRDAASSLKVVIIAAVAENGVIGAGGGLPWEYPEDIAHFRETTIGHPVVMGRHTFDNITNGLGEPLPKRKSIVLTSQGLTGEFADYDSVCVASNLREAFAAAERACDRCNVEAVYVAGGEFVYASILPIADKLLLTHIPETPVGDAYFPQCDSDCWEVIRQSTRGEVVIEEYDRAVVTAGTQRNLR